MPPKAASRRSSPGPTATPRRSGRLKTPSVTQSARSRRTTNALPDGPSPRALPALAVSRSHAYGAEGKTVLSQALNAPAKPNLKDTFAAAIAPSTFTPQADQSSTRRQRFSDEFVNGTIIEAEEEATDIDVSKSFGTQRESGIINGVAHDPIADPLDAFQEVEDPEPVESSPIDVVENSVSVDTTTYSPLRYYTKVAKEFLPSAFKLTGKFLFNVFTCSLLAVLFLSLLHQAGLYPGYLPGATVGDQALAHLQSMVATLQNDVSAIELVQKDLIHRQGGSNDDLLALRSAFESFANDIPDFIVLSRSRDAGLDIPDYIFNAFRDRLEREGFSAGSSTDSEQFPETQLGWEKFINRNRVRLQALMRDEVSSAADGALKNLLTRENVVSRQELLDLIAERASSARFDLKQIAETTAIDAIKKHLPVRVLDQLAASNLLKNSELALKHVNYFSASLGARIDPRRSSSFADNGLSSFGALWKVVARTPKRNTASTALENWSEAGDAWCSSPVSGKGLAQVAVEMPYTIYPSKFTIEHIPKTGTPDIYSAPQWVELYVLINDPAKRAEIEQHRAELVGEAGRCSDRNTLEADYVCVGKYRYNIDVPNHVQTWDLDVNLQDYGIGTDTAVVKVVSNYGRHFTCLYRVRLNGEQVSPVATGIESGDAFYS